MTAHLTEEQLNGYADGSLEPLARAEAARHLEDCAACRAEIAGIRDLFAAAHRLPKSVEPPRDLWPEIRTVVYDDTAPTTRTTIRWSWVAAVAAAMALVVGLQFVPLVPRDAWEVTTLAGTPRVGTAVVTGSGALRVGEWLETDGVSRARIAVGRIGQVEVRPRTRVRLVEARPAAHRLALARGAISARVDAPPRIFIVETPAGTAIDLGCAYTLEVDSLGNGLLRVTAGWVEFAWRERRAIVPLGFAVATRPGAGPGVPVVHDAPADLRAALAAFDAGGSATALRAALAAARAEDAVSVWHLLERVDAGLRGAVYDRLVQLVPPPPGVTREAMLELDRAALDLSWSALRRIAWRREILRGIRDIDPRTGRTRTPA